MINDTMRMHGAATLQLIKANGEVEVTHKDNLIVDVGFDFIADCIGKSSGRPAIMKYVGIGSSSAAVSASNTALGSQLTRRSGAYSHTAGTKTFTIVETFPPGSGTGAIQEAGVFNASSGGTMFDRVTFPVINKGSDDTLTVTFTFTMS